MSLSTCTKRKYIPSETLDIISTKRSEVLSSGSKPHNVENIPDNKQHETTFKALQGSVPIMPFDGLKLVSKNQQLNLRTRAATSKTKKAREQETASTFKDTVTGSSDEIEHQQILSVNKNNLKSNDLEKISERENDRNDSDSSEGQNPNIKSCPVCTYYFTTSSSDTEINEHINRCLDGKKTDQIVGSSPSEQCQICNKDISKYNSVRRQQHINRCCDDFEKTTCPPTVATSFHCPICGKPFKTTRTRQTHMKKCAKENNLSTQQLVELNRRENNITNPTSSAVCSSSSSGNPNQDTLNVFKTSKRKRKANLPAKNLDDATQLALALSASMKSDSDDIISSDHELQQKKKKKETSELPALLLRSEDEMKKVTEARAAEVLCQWAEDDQIQCTPALAPSSLVKKYGEELTSAHEKLEVVPEQTSECDIEDISETEWCHSPTIEVRIKPEKRKDEKCDCEKNSESGVATFAHSEESKKYFTVDRQSRLWKLASLRADIVANNDFYVPNLLPTSTPRTKAAPCSKSTPRKKNTPTKGTTRRKKATSDRKNVTTSSTSTASEKRSDHYAAVEKDNEGSLSKFASQNRGLTESQEEDIEMLVELLSDESSADVQSNDDKEEIDNTWFPSSGFCVRKDTHEMEEKNKEHVNTLLNDLSCMVGNPLLSDVEIVAKDNKKFCAHSFMLSARCTTLAELLQTSGIYRKDDNRSSLVRVEVLDIDVRAVQAVLTYIYTAVFFPVVNNVVEDVKKLALRWNLNCDMDKWEVIEEETVQDNENDAEHEGNTGDLDVLLRSLWEGEEEVVINKEEQNMFGDSILDDELGDMEVKIYPQATPQKEVREITNESDEHFVLTLDSDSVNCTEENVVNDLVVASHKLDENIMQNNGKGIFESSDDVCIPETPLKLSLCNSSSGRVPESDLMQGDVTPAKISPEDALRNKQSITPDRISDPPILGTCSPRCHSSPIKKDVIDSDINLGSSPIFRLSPSSSAEMMSSPERSPLAEDLDDLIQDETIEFEKAQTQKISNNPIMSNSSTSSLDKNKCCRESMKYNSQDISIVLPNCKTTTLPVFSSTIKVDIAVVDKEDNVNETVEVFEVQKDNANLVKRTATSSHNKRKKSLDREENDSLLDLFSPESITKQSFLNSSNVEDLVIDGDEPLQPDENDNRQDRRFHDGDLTHEDVTKTKSELSCAIATQDESWLDDSSLQVKKVSGSEAKCTLESSVRNDQVADWLDDSPMEINDTKDNRQEDFCDDQLIDCYDDGGFNCDINDYFNYDTNSAIEGQCFIPDNEKPGTSTSTVVNAAKSIVEDEKMAVASNHQQVVNRIKNEVRKEKNNTKITESDLNEKISKEAKKGNGSETGGKSHKRQDKSKQSKTDPPQQFKLREPRTPMLDYSNMATPDLKGELKQYGVRPLAKRKMVIKLKEIYNYIHRESESDEDKDEMKSSTSKQQPISDDDLVQTEDTNSQHESTQDTESLSDSDQNWQGEELSDDADMLSQASSPNLFKTLITFLTQDHELYYKILKHMPISPSEVLETIKGNGIKCSANQLKDFFDEQCITYSEPRPARVRRRGRRGKAKQTNV